MDKKFVKRRRKVVRDRAFTILLFVAFVALAVIAVISSFNGIKYEVSFMNRPEQHEYAEVSAKRVVVEKGTDSDRTVYLVEFSLSDGSLKEFLVSNKYSPIRTVYNAFQEGETGVLTYIEAANVNEKYKDDVVYKGRRFISFEKAPEHGGLTIDDSELASGSLAGAILLGGLLSGGTIVTIFFLFRGEFKNAGTRRRKRCK